jgi:hypothetical protein
MYDMILVLKWKHKQTLNYDLLERVGEVEKMRKALCIV